MTLSEKLKALIEASSAPSSRKALSCDLAVFERWYSGSGSDEYLPANDLIVAEFIAAMADKRSVSTIIRYVSSLSKIHELSGWPNPTRSELVRQALSGLRKTRGMRARQAPALTGKELLKILQSLSKTSYLGQRNRAMFCLGWSCGLRCAELQALDVSDLEFPTEESTSTVVHIRRSKTDTYGKGYSIGIPASPITKILKQWTDMLVALYLSENGPLFPRLSYSNVERYFPRKGMRAPLSIRGISKTIRTVMEQNGIRGSVHSLRRGVITEAARLNVPEHLIQRHSRHASTRSLRGYIEEGTIFSDNPLPAIFDSLFGSRQEL
jgi:integrase